MYDYVIQSIYDDMLLLFDIILLIWVIIFYLKLCESLVLFFGFIILSILERCFYKKLKRFEENWNLITALTQNSHVS